MGGEKEEIPSLEEFKAWLEKFDWFYSMSDSADVYKKGSAAEAELGRIAVFGGPEFIRAYEAARPGRKEYERD